MIYKDRGEYNRRLDKISDFARGMLENLPWPLSTVYVDSESNLGEAVSEFYREVIRQ